MRSVDEDYLKDKVAIVAHAVSVCQRSLVVACEKADFLGQKAPWARVMSRTRRFFDALNVPTFDGSSMCSALSQYRVSTANCKRNEWTSNFSVECRKALVKERGNLRFLVELIPTRN